ncbi:Agenet domain-containing protein / bromo-adjacent domain-containing protein, putative isoform 2 [Theobroma cacao]|nr:Agenet domain-containing protein / bromo-adjacent domain-containing protein, putative isoform 2 [Theobroma cacao]EOY02093.1 Agenet domain-containing protein / bromo-adjacent domain-containing protein, putative isoform 2 [Theobroma cacao]
MVVVRWFHKIDEVGIVLPHNYNSREIFSSLCLQDLSIECIDGLATVLSPEHFKKYLNEAMHTQLEPFVCCKQFENDDVKPFDVTQVKGYWKQDILRYMYSLSLSNDCVSHQQRADDQKADWNVDDGVGIRPRKKYRQSKDDDVCLHFSGSRESMDASCADVLDMGNGKNGTESFSLSGGSSAFLSADGAKQNFSQHLKVGSQVEILAQDSGIRGCWFRALIIKKHKDKVKVQYQDLQDAADEANKLEEWILASRVAVPDQMGIRFGGRTTIRPSPQNPKGSASCIDVGSVVDVWWHGGWWEGIVFKKDSEDKLHVYFPGEKRESVFDSGDVRPSQEWLGNRWINIKERHDLVSSILRGRKQDAGKSYDCNLVKTTVGDGGQFAKGATIGCNDSPVEPGNDRAKDVGLVPDLSKDDLLSQLKWKSSRKRRRGTGTSVQKQNCGCKRIKSTAEVTRSVTCERFLIPASLKLDNDNCKYRGDPLFSSSVVPPLTSLVMTR